MDELISRQAAIDTLEKDKTVLSQIISGMSENDAQLKYYVAQRNQVVYDIDAIEQLPSAQPEPLTDKEQRIFLAAIGREEKVCKEVDAEMTGEPYEDSLVRVCREIERKVKKALWTN